MTFLYKGDARRGAVWAEQFARKMPGMPFCIWLTPRVASATQAETAAQALLDNLRRHDAGLPLEGVVDRSHGY